MIKVTTALGWVLRLYGLTQHPVNGVFMVWTDRSGEPQALNYLSSIPDNREMSVGAQLVEHGTGMEKRGTAYWTDKIGQCWTNEDP